MNYHEVGVSSDLFIRKTKNEKELLGSFNSSTRNNLKKWSVKYAGSSRDAKVELICCRCEKEKRKRKRFNEKWGKMGVKKKEWYIKLKKEKGKKKWLKKREYEKLKCERKRSGK